MLQDRSFRTAELKFLFFAKILFWKPNISWLQKLVYFSNEHVTRNFNKAFVLRFVEIDDLECSLDHSKWLEEFMTPFFRLVKHFINPITHYWKPYGLNSFIKYGSSKIQLISLIISISIWAHTIIGVDYLDDEPGISYYDVKLSHIICSTLVQLSRGLLLKNKAFVD